MRPSVRLLLAAHILWALSIAQIFAAPKSSATAEYASSFLGEPNPDVAAVALPPSLYGVAGGGAIELGQQINLTVSFSGSGLDQIYQWQKGTTDIVGATGISYVIAAAVVGDAGTYSVKVTNPGGSSVASTSVTIKALAAPVITSSPFSRTASVGQSTSFAASATGSYPRTYQWLKNSTAITGATDETYAIAVIAIADAGTYAVTITNSQGSATSSAASLTVNGATPPVLYPGYPSSTNRIQGEQVTLSIYTSSGSSPFTYQWYKNGVVISGATNSQLSFNAVALLDAGRYTVAVTNVAGTVTSGEAVLAVTPATPITITRHPVSLSITQGQSAYFSVSTSGSSPATYQWKKDGVAITTATYSDYSISAAALADAGSYTVTITNVVGAVTSNAAVLTVTAPVAPTITTQPVAQTVDYSVYSTSFTVQVSGSYPFTYVWKKDDVVVNTTTATSSNSNSLYLYSPTAANGGVYTVSVTNAAGSVSSSGATLTVRAAVLPAITTQPVSATIDPGTYYYRLYVGYTSTGTGPLTLQWRKDGVAISGATYSDYSVPSPAKVSDSGDYTVVITGAAGSVTSSAARLNVIASAPTIATQPTNQSTSVNGSAYFSAYVTGTGPITYQWSKDGVAVSGATSYYLYVYPRATTDGGIYTVVATNATGSVTSNGATLTVAAIPVAPTIASQPTSQTITVGGTATFTVVASGSSPFYYDWYKNGSYYASTASGTLTISNAQFSSAGSYIVYVGNSVAYRSSVAAVLTVNAASTVPVFTTGPASQLAKTGGTVVFNPVVSGTAPISYQWQKDGANIPSATSSTLTLSNVSAADAGSYRLVATNAAGSATSSSATLTLILNAADFAGTYFGQFGSNASDRFALVVRADGTAMFLGYAGSKKAGYAAANFKLNNDSTFSVDLPEISAGASSSSIGDKSAEIVYASAAAATMRKFTGSLAPTGLKGSIEGTGLTLAATKSPATGAAQSVAGVYQSVALNSTNDTLTVVVDATGQAFVFAQMGASSDGGSATLNVATGKLAATLSGGSQATATINASAGSVSANVSTAANQTSSFAGLADTVVHTDRLANISSRANIGAGDVMIAGFVITGTTSKPILIRAVGPTLAAFGVAGAIANPKLELYRGNTKITENDDWASTISPSDVAAAATRTGAFALGATSKDSALLSVLPPGAYTAQVSGVGVTGGVALVEVYDASEGTLTAASPRIVNISTRANVTEGGGILIAGIVVTGNSPKRILIRATGPALAAFGVPGTLADPLLKLYNGNTLLWQNDNWSDSSADAALVAAAGTAAGAFALAPGSKDAALLLTLEPGSYTAHVTGVGASTGVALVEVYEVSR